MSALARNVLVSLVALSWVADGCGGTTRADGPDAAGTAEGADGLGNAMGTESLGTGGGGVQGEVASGYGNAAGAGNGGGGGTQGEAGADDDAGTANGGGVGTTNAGGATDGGGSHDSAPSDGPDTFGAVCSCPGATSGSACFGTDKVCSATPGIDCVGIGSRAACTHACTSDDDCAGGQQSMKCLSKAQCPSSSTFAAGVAVAMGVCWSVPNYTTLISYCQ